MRSNTGVRIVVRVRGCLANSILSNVFDPSLFSLSCLAENTDMAPHELRVFYVTHAGEKAANTCAGRYDA